VKPSGPDALFGDMALIIDQTSSSENTDIMQERERGKPHSMQIQAMELRLSLASDYIKVIKNHLRFEGFIYYH
jgi:hypothetical protein